MTRISAIVTARRLAIALALVPAVVAGQAQPLDTVRVEVASRAAPSLVSAQRAVEVVDRAAIERKAVRSVADLLATVVGADIQGRSAAQADLSIRGSALGQVLVLVDGIRMSDLQTAHFDLDLAVPLDAIERIEVLRGSASSLYGPDAIGGVVNVVTRRGGGWQTARIHGGSFGTVGAAVAAAGTAGRTSLRATVDAERSAGHRPGTDYDLLQSTAGVDHGLGGGRLTADVGVALREFGAQDFYAPAPSLERTRALTGAVRYNGPAASAWDIGAAAAVRRHTDDFILRRADPAFYRNLHRSWQTTVEATARRQVHAAAALAFGAEAFDAQLESARLGNRREQRGSAFTEATFGSTAGANLSAGVRVDHSSTVGTFASPSAAASMPVGTAFRLRASAGRGLRAPSWTERYYRDPTSVANPNVGEERFWTAELGARALPRWGRVDVAAFVREAEDLIDWVRPADMSTPVPWTTANLERATYRGVEIVIAAPALLGVDWMLNATGLALDAAAAQGVVGKYALRPLTRIVGMSASRELLRGLRTSTDVRHARRVGESAYLHVNVRAAYEVRRGTAYVDLTNLTAADYLDASAKPVAGRALMVGLRVR